MKFYNKSRVSSVIRKVSKKAMYLRVVSNTLKYLSQVKEVFKGNSRVYWDCTKTLVICEVLKIKTFHQRLNVST